MKLMGERWPRPYALVIEEVVDVVVGDLSEHGRCVARGHLLDERVEDLREILGGLLHSQAHEPER